jgi:hypothetical protein
VQGLRPTIPENINPKLSELLQRCWKTNSTERPGFSEITGLLEEILKQVCMPVRLEAIMNARLKKRIMFSFYFFVIFFGENVCTLTLLT